MNGRRRATRRRKQSLTSWSDPEKLGIVTVVVSMCSAGGACLAGLGVGWCIGIPVAVFCVLGVVTHLIHLRRVTAAMERLIAAGEFKLARRLGERAGKHLAKEARFQALMGLAEKGEEGPEVPTEPVVPAAPAGEEPALPAEAPPEAPRSTEPVEEPVPELPPGPAERVISPLAGVVIALLVPALVPALGSLAAPALLVLSLILLSRKSRRAWDARIARFGLAASVLGTIASAAGAAALFAGDGGDGEISDLVSDVTTRMQIIQIAMLVLSVVFHEVAHGVAARISGDATAESKGRLSLNPIRHLDPLGSVILPIVLSLMPGGVVFGWAKPVPVDPSRYRRPRGGNAFVSIAGVGANVILALVCGALLFLTAFAISRLRPGHTLPQLYQPLVGVRASWLPGGVVMEVWIEILKAGILVNLVLASLNLAPIPPLDGAHLLRSILPKRASDFYAKLGVLGFPLLLVLMFTDAILIVFLPGLLVAMLL
ncbi:MAG: site-2 protease family protein, partial [Planctomycetota bacterium]